MPMESAGPLTRPVDVTRLPDGGAEFRVEASEEERAALAQNFGLPAVHRLVGRFRLAGTPRRVAVKGEVEASVRQVCVVTLEPFDATLREEVDVDYSESTPPAKGDPEGYEAPDEITDGKVDLGALTAEFLALGLDPHPRKPGAQFAFEAEPLASPFAGLAKLKGDD